MTERVAIPESYEIYQQDLTKDYLCLTPMGFIRTIAENVCYVIEQTENTHTDPYYWDIVWYIALPNNK